jgi:hypothetical protein
MLMGQCVKNPWTLAHAVIWLLAAASTARAQAPAALIASAEQAFADMNDASGALGLIDSGFAATYLGRDRSAWERALAEHMRTARQALKKRRVST